MASDISDHSEFQQTPRDYLRVFGMFFRNSVVREMTFRGNFIIQVVTRAVWFAAQLSTGKSDFNALYTYLQYWQQTPDISTWTYNLRLFNQSDGKSKKVVKD